MIPVVPHLKVWTTAYDANTETSVCQNEPVNKLVSGHSLVEEGEQIAHHHQRRPRDAQQDFTDALRPLIHVLDP